VQFKQIVTISTDTVRQITCDFLLYWRISHKTEHTVHQEIRHMEHSISIKQYTI